MVDLHHLVPDLPGFTAMDLAFGAMATVVPGQSRSANDQTQTSVPTSDEQLARDLDLATRKWLMEHQAASYQDRLNFQHTYIESWRRDHRTRSNSAEPENPPSAAPSDRPPPVTLRSEVRFESLREFRRQWLRDHPQGTFSYLQKQDAERIFLQNWDREHPYDPNRPGGWGMPAKKSPAASSNQSTTEDKRLGL